MYSHCLSVTNGTAFRIAAIACVIAFGLLLDQHVASWGQLVTNVAVWVIFAAILLRAPRLERIALIACVLYATAGEVFLSLVWGLYDYRLGNIPLFVPPGHALLFMLGMIIAPRVSDRAAWAVPILAAPFVLWLAVTGIDTLGPLLLALLVACMALGSARKLYATMFVLALAMEIYGTWLGNWAWAAHVPWLGLETVNPPLAAGAFYCVLDLLVTATSAVIRRRRPSAAVHFAASATAGQP